jgi:hypothetical protein
LAQTSADTGIYSSRPQVCTQDIHIKNHMAGYTMSAEAQKVLTQGHLHENRRYDAESEEAILWSTLRQLQGISASWDMDAYASALEEDNDPSRQSSLNSNGSNQTVDSSNFGEGSGSPGLEMPSLGSNLHNVGECRPCVYAGKNKCTAAAECLFCHYPHEVPKRPGKNSRRRAMARHRREVDVVDEVPSRQVSNDNNAEYSTQCPTPPLQIEVENQGYV